MQEQQTRDHSTMSVQLTSIPPHAPDFRVKINELVRKGNISVAVATITPETAEVLLERNKERPKQNGAEGIGSYGRAFMQYNRKQSVPLVQKYSAAMRDNRWRLTGQPIILSRSGVLLDGQHRLKSCLSSKHSFRSLVVFGIEDDAFSFIDQGKKRNSADIFHSYGVSSPADYAAAAQWVWRYQKGKMKDIKGTAKRMDPEMLYRFYQSLPGFYKSHPVARKFMTHRWIPRSVIFALHWLMSELDAALAHSFFERLATGVTESHDDPVYKLREKLIALHNRKGSQMDPVYLAALIVNTWNFERGYVHGRRSTPRLTWRDRKSDEEFPEIL